MNLSTLALIPGIQGWDYIIILAILLLLFGAKKLPELAQGMGKGIREFKKAATEAEDTFREAADIELDKKKEEKKPRDSSPELTKEKDHA